MVDGTIPGTVVEAGRILPACGGQSRIIQDCVVRGQVVQGIGVPARPGPVHGVPACLIPG